MAVIDGNFRFVVRRPSRPRQRLRQPSLRQAIDSLPGWTRGELLDGARLPHRPAFLVQPLGGVDVGADQHRRLNLRFLWLLWAGFAVAGGLGLWFAWWLAAACRADPRDARRHRRSARASRSARCGLGGRAAPAGARARRGCGHDPRARGQAAGGRAAAARRRRARTSSWRCSATSCATARLGGERLAPAQAGAAPARRDRDRRRDPRPPGRADDRLVDDLLEVGRVTGGKIGWKSPSTWPVVAAVIELAQWIASAPQVESDLHEVWATPTAPGSSRSSPICSTTPSSTRRQTVGSTSRCGRRPAPRSSRCAIPAKACRRS